MTDAVYQWRRLGLKASYRFLSCSRMSAGSTSLKQFATDRASLNISTKPGESGAKEMKKAKDQVKEEIKMAKEHAEKLQAQAKEMAKTAREAMEAAKMKARQLKAEPVKVEKSSSSSSSSDPVK